MFNEAPIRREDVGDHVGPHQLSAVDHGADGRCHFEVGDLAALPEGAGGQLHRAHPVGGVVQALLRLRGQVDAGGLPEAEGGEVVAESLPAQPGTDLDEALVAGVFERLGHGLGPVALVVGAVEPRPGHRDGLAAVETGMPGDGPGIQRGGAGDELEDAARFVEVADGLVPPLGLLGQLQGGTARLAGKALHLVPGGFVRDDAGLVGVVGGGGGHGQHGPGVHVHHDAYGPRGNMVFLHRVPQRVFQIVLDLGVDGQPQAVALGGKTLGLVALFQRVAPGVDRSQHHAVLAGEQAVVLQLQPGDPGVVHIGEPQHRREELPLRIPPFGVLIDADAGDAVGLTERPHPVGGGAVHPVAEQAVVGAAVAERFQQAGRVEVQDVCKALGGEGELVVWHLAGRGAERPAAAVRRQQNAVGAVNFAPVGGHDGVPQLLAEGTVGVPAAGAQLQIKQPRRQPQADGAE